ncbi:MAG: D-cysteine desulfhydrase [Succiniclasticum sp.]
MLYSGAELNTILDKYPRCKLGFFPTPLYYLSNMSKYLGIKLYIKRDDFSGQSLFGGNKIRKLEFLLADALKKHSNCIFTYGASQSNHAMQTAESCCKLGLKCVLYLADLVGTKEIKGNLLVDKIMGAEVHLIQPLPNESFQDTIKRMYELARKQQKELEEEGIHCYDIPMGGANSIGTLGFISGFAEFENQSQTMGKQFDYLVHATGSGGTMTGLVIGKKLLGDPVTILSMDAGAHGADYVKEKVQMGNSTLQSMGLTESLTEEDFHIDTTYSFPGYEKPSSQANKAIKLLARQEGILLDPVYSGKAFAGLIDYVKKGKIPGGSRVLFWHTGGITALFAEENILGDILDE